MEFPQDLGVDSCFAVAPQGRDHGVEASAPGVPGAAHGRACRILYIFDPVRRAVLLVGGNKVGKGNRWYPAAIRQAEKLYTAYLIEIERERKEQT